MSQGLTGFVIRTVLAVVCAGIAVWGVLPTFGGRFHIGCMAMIVVGGIGTAVCIWFPHVVTTVQSWWATAIGRGLLCMVGAVAAALVVLFAVVSGNMIAACTNVPSENATVIVLGAALRGDRPSLSLRTRLEVALDYLQEHPQASCVVSGGQGANEEHTEASVMKAWLVERGISPDRIFEEDRSTSTFENVSYSHELIEREGLTPHVAIVTQEFHQFRAQQLARHAGVSVSGAVVAHTPWYLLGSYWIRDFVGVCHMVVFGT